VLLYTQEVEVIKTRVSEWEARNGQKQTTTYLVVRGPSRDGSEQYDYPIHEAMNGGTPSTGDRVGLVLHTYVFEQARTSQRTGNAYISREQKLRVVGVYDVSKGPQSFAGVHEFAQAA